MSLITVSAGAAGADIEPGTYTVTLVSIEGPKTITPRSGPNAGVDIEIFDWNFAIDDGEYAGTEISATTSMASGPRSKMYSYLTALFDGKAPAIGATFDAGDLCGRVALATISKVEGGWPRIETLSALPKQMRAPAPRPKVADTRAAAVPVGEASADLPF